MGSRLRLGVDVPAALNLVGRLVTPLGAAFLFPAAVAIGYGEAVWPWLVGAAVTSASGAVLQRLTSGGERVSGREGYLVVALLWLLVAVFGAVPYVLAEPQLAEPVDAFFESMSGFSATGATVLTDVEGLSRSVAMWRQFTVWIGGLGIIVLFLAVLPRLNVAGRQAMFKAEAAGPEIGLEATIRESARRFLRLYVAITALEVAVLAAFGWFGVDPRMDLFRAVGHAFATISTAGFSTEGRSIEPFAPATQWVIVAFMVLAGTNFALLYAGIVLRRMAAFRRDEEFRVYAIVLVTAAALVVVGLAHEGRFEGEPLARHAVFNTVSMMTTTGFASTDFNQWPSLSTFVLFGLLLIGASAGSTSGGVKLVRHIVIAKMLRREVHNTVHPDLVAPLRISGSVVDERTLRAIIVFTFIYVGVWALGTIAVLVDSSMRDLDVSAFQALADSITALSGTGPGLGLAGPMGSFAPFGSVSKVVLAGEMYLGRLEIIPVLVLLTRSYWRA